MAKGKAVYPGPNEDIVCGVEDHHIKAIKRIIDDDQFIESATRIVEKTRCLLSNQEQSLSLPDKRKSIANLNHRIFDVHQSLTNLSNDEHEIIDRYLGEVNASTMSDMTQHLWKLHIALTQAQKDDNFLEAKPKPESIHKEYAVSLACELIPLMQKHEIPIKCTASETRISDAIHLLQILGESAGLCFKPDTWSRHLSEAKK